MKNETYCVIMAGGVGSRFWPLSQEETPKQFIDILGTGRTLIQQTYDRFEPICPKENFFIVTSSSYRQIVLEQLPEIDPKNILCEPSRRNTAPCIAYASERIRLNNPNAKIIVSPADHLILKEDDFREVIIKGLDFVSKSDTLLTLGIKPAHPETGYGYIQVEEKPTNKNQIVQVKTFTEKPNLELAKVFVESGEFFWNSGIFLWSLKSISKAFDKYAPEVSALFSSKSDMLGTNQEGKVIEGIYYDCKSISIDYAIMEKADNVHVLVSDFGWSDLGTWGSLYTHSEKDRKGNAKISGSILFYNAKNNIVNLTHGKTAVIQGLTGFIVVETKDEILICPKENEQQIREFSSDVKTLREKL